MAPIKFEENLKDRLEKRTIEPSSTSWDTLSQRLDNEEKKRGKKGYFWLAIAASVIGVLLISKVVINSNSLIVPDIIVTDEDTEKDTSDKFIEAKSLETPKQEVIVKTENNTTIENSKTKSKTKSKRKANQEAYIVNVPSPVVLSNNREKNAVEVLPITTTVESNKSITTSVDSYKPKESAAPIKAIEISSIEVTDSELNALLSDAYKDIALQKNTKVKIPEDYNGLLMEVEDNLEESFRDKMLKDIRKGYENVKEFVAERND